MGVGGLWELLSPVGRRVSIETLAGKKLAIDASIWMIQFMKAMRDEKGEMVRNAHLLGFFRRICKLLYLRVKPIFIFDGGTPALKRRTVIARRRQRENAQAKIRKTAEKLLLNHLKAMKLKEIAQDIKDQRQKQNSAAKGKKVLPDETKVSKNYSEKYDAISGSYNQEKLDEMLAASIAAEEDESLTYSKMMAPAAGLCEEDGDEDEDMMLPDMHGEVDSSVLAALAPSLQHKLIQKQEVDSKCKKTRSDEINILGIQSELGGAVVRNQVKLDEMLAASIMAEEDGGVNNKASTSAAAISFEDGDADDESGDEEMILPTMHGKVDPAVLAALPPSMQLDLLVQIRERLMAENRQKYQKVKKDPGKFSELQIEAYLKTVAFRREIDQVQKAAAGRGVGGIQTSRIASESNRKFIFSSSFTGDKQVLAAGRAEKCGDKQQETLVHSSSSTNTVSSANKSNKTGSNPDDSGSVLDENIETYQDERGRMRVSRVRAMGIRMTRDLQRNLDLMKEIELERTSAHNISNSLSVLSGGNHDVPENFTGTSEVVGTSQDSGIGSVKVNERNEECMLETNGCIEISFEDNGDNKFVDGEDDLFACLVTGNNTGISSCDNTSSKNLLSISDSDCEWEEGAIEERGQGSLDNVGLKMELPAVDNISDDTEVEWEEVVCEDSKVIPPCPTNSVKLKSKGCVEEDADLEEAIRRSLEDIEDQRSDYTCQDEKQKVPLEKVHKANCFLVEENKIDRLLSPVVNAAQPMGSNVEIMNAIEKVDAEQVAISNNCFCPNKPFKPSMESNSDDWTLVQVAIPCERERGSTEEQICYDREGGNLFKKETNYADFGPSGTEEFKVVEDHNLDASKDNGGISTFNTAGAKGNPCSDDDITDAVLVDKKNSPKAGPSSCSVEVDNSTISLVDSVTKELRSNIYDHQNLVTKENHEIFLEEGEKILENSTVKDNENVQVHFTEANLEEEIKTLEEECIYLGNEHKRLERNAESVSSEMFTECQELLQMFGLPYIIAPMEAEAQCAFMEKVNIVDGVVTDDSDAFLFGARSVYKNIFDDRKYVETYFMKDIENELGLTREKLIRMALLLGSDYTEGVSGIGIVNAIEVVNAFPEEDGLKKFRDWVESPDPTILGKSNVQTGSSARKKCSKVGDGDISRFNVEEASRSHGNSPQDQKQQQSSAHIQETTQIFMDKHRKISKNWHIPLSFPSEAVISAYSCPQVDKSTESFTWGKPDHFVLRKLCWEKFGWVSQKADEILLPVLKEYSKHETQLRLEAFYTFNERFAKVRSKRIKKAVEGIIGNRSSVMAVDDNQKVSRSREKKRSKPIEPGDDETEMLSEQQIHGTVMGNRRSNRKKATSKHSQNRLTPGEEDLSEPSSFPEGGESTNRSSRVNGKGGGRRGKGKVVGRGKEKGSASFQTSETSSSDTGNNDDDAMKFSERSDGQEVRRSMRLRKPVDYTSNDVEIDDVDGSVYQSDKNCSPDMAEEKYLFSSSGMNEGAAASGVIEEKQQCADTFSLGEGSSRNYLEAGGGFCLDEGESDQLHDYRQDDSPEAELSDDYLKMGPGLSVVVDGIATNEDKSPVPATATISTSANLSRYSVVGASDGHALEQGADQVNTIISNDNQNASDGTGKRSIGALSVMPNLRRKRRRN